MPVQINEIIVRTVVETQPTNAAQAQQPDAARGAGSAEEMLERVLEIIQESKER